MMILLQGVLRVLELDACVDDDFEVDGNSELVYIRLAI